MHRQISLNNPFTGTAITELVTLVITLVHSGARAMPTGVLARVSRAMTDATAAIGAVVPGRATGPVGDGGCAVTTAGISEGAGTAGGAGGLHRRGKHRTKEKNCHQSGNAHNGHLWSPALPAV